MKILINQPFGLGDVIFCMTIVRRWVKEGHSVLWPVLPQFVEGLRRAYPDVIFEDWRIVKVDYERKDEHDNSGYRVVPLRWNVEIMEVPYSECMATKYSMFGLDYSIWKEGAMWNRDFKKEEELFKILCGKRPYRVVNEYYTSNSGERVQIPNKIDLLTVNMGTIPGYSLFDWAMILERATEIHTVSTSIIYLLELLDIAGEKVHLYPRPTDPQFKQVDYLFTKPYNLHA